MLDQLLKYYCICLYTLYMIHFVYIMECQDFSSFWEMKTGIFATACSNQNVHFSCGQSHNVVGNFHVGDRGYLGW